MSDTSYRVTVFYRSAALSRERQGQLDLDLERLGDAAGTVLDGGAGSFHDQRDHTFVYGTEGEARMLVEIATKYLSAHFDDASSYGAALHEPETWLVLADYQAAHFRRMDRGLEQAADAVAEATILEAEFGGTGFGYHEARFRVPDQATAEILQAALDSFFRDHRNASSEDDMDASWEIRILADTDG